MTIAGWCFLFCVVCLIAKIAFECGEFSGEAKFLERYRHALANWNKNVLRNLDRQDKRRRKR